MRFNFDAPLSAYLNATDQIAGSVLALNSPFRQAADETYIFFVNRLLDGEITLRPVSALLAGNAFMLWLASVRVAAGGHAAAAYPVFRVALESACYCLVTQRDDAKAEIWRDRDKSPELAKRCRQVMTTAVKDAATILNRDEDGIGDGVAQMYQNAIDFGAHPNAKSIFSHLRFAPEANGSEHHELHLAGLSGPDSFEVRRALIASLEYAFVIGTVLLHALPEADQERANALGELQNITDRVTRAWGLMVSE